MPNERPNDAIAQANDEQLKDLAPAEISEEQLRGRTDSKPTEYLTFQFKQVFISSH